MSGSPQKWTCVYSTCASLTENVAWLVQTRERCHTFDKPSASASFGLLYCARRLRARFRDVLYSQFLGVDEQDINADINHKCHSY
jgi:hypothetical protein